MDLFVLGRHDEVMVMECPFEGGVGDEVLEGFREGVRVLYAPFVGDGIRVVYDYELNILKDGKDNRNDENGQGRA